MDNRELLRTLAGCKFYQKYLEIRQPPGPAAPESVSRSGNGRPQASDVSKASEVCGMGSKSNGAQPSPSRFVRRVQRRVFRKYCAWVGALLAATVALIIAPLWLAHPPYGRAFLLSLPPMLLCALSWMSGAWWAWGKGRFVFIAITLGATPARLFLGLAWAWLVLSIPDTPCFAFLLGLMWHWLVFTVPEIAMMYELSLNRH